MKRCLMPRGRLILTLFLILLPRLFSDTAHAENLEKHLGLYQVVNTDCELTKGLHNPCAEIKFFEFVKGIFHGVDPEEIAFVTWKIHENDMEATYEAVPVKQHQNLILTDDKLWLTDITNRSHQAYFILNNGKITGHRFLLIKKNKTGVLSKRDFYYQLSKISRKEIKSNILSYPAAIPMLEENQAAYKDSTDAIHKKAVVDENITSDFFRSTVSSFKWHVIKHEDGSYEDTLDGEVSREDTIPVLHTANCISTHQGDHVMNFCDAVLMDDVLQLHIHGGLPAYSSRLLVEIRPGGQFFCFFKGTYPGPSAAIEWKILSKELYLTTLDFKKGSRIFGWILVTFEEMSTYKGEKFIQKHQIKGEIKPVIK